MEAMTDVFEVVRSTINDGNIDMGAFATTADDEINIALGMRVKDGERLDATFKRAVDFAKGKSEQEFSFKPNAKSMGGISFHECVFPVPEDEEEARDLFGDSVKAYVGISDNRFYMGIGSSPMELLGDAMERSKEAVDSELPPMQYNLYLTPVLQLLSRVEDEETLGALADALEEGGRDRVRIVTTLIPNGQRFRVEVQDGILKMIGAAAVQMQEGGGGGFDF